MRRISRISLGSMLACALAVAMIALPSAAQAANPGEVCNTNSITVIDNSKGEIIYIVEGGTPMRIEAYAGPELYYGHAEGKANGYFLRSQINQSSCHKT
jgi:hypothetical protein